MAGDGHDRLFAGLRLRKLGDRMVPQVMKTESVKGILDIPDIRLAFPIAASLGRIL
jgi:hypothetical protein